jgi:NAD(P)-dependent dehydrogenase (short-subunit alcohol dehydrogenase family)
MELKNKVVLITGATAGIGRAGVARFMKADLADLASSRRLAQGAGEVDILVNNAAAS